MRSRMFALSGGHLAGTLNYGANRSRYGGGYPRADGTTLYNTIAIPLNGHYQLLRLLRGLRWPDMTIAVGQGEEILALAENDGAETGRESPPSDFANDLIIEMPDDAGELRLKCEIHPAVEAHKSTVPLAERNTRSTTAFRKYKKNQEASDARLYEFLGEVYLQALRAATHEDELKALVAAKGMSFNSASDLFALSLKLAIPAEAYDKRRASEWATAWRYLYSQSCAADGAASFFETGGGVKHCVARQRELEKSRLEAPGAMMSEEAWDSISGAGQGFEVATNQLELPKRDRSKPSRDASRAIANAICAKTSRSRP